MVHSYSLIHDDLPAIDNDDLAVGVNMSRAMMKQLQFWPVMAYLRLLFRF